MTKLTGPQRETTNILVRLNALHPMSLCCHYFSAHFEEQPAEVRVAGGGSAELAVSWAVGVLADGDGEVLGAWPGAAAGPAFWRGIWEDFDDRGVNKISWVCTADRDARALCQTAKVLPPFRRILGHGHVLAASRVAVLCVEARRAVRQAASVRMARVALERLLPKLGADEAAVLAPDWPEVLSQFEAFYALPAERRAVVRRGDEVLEQLSRTLTRAVVRHGPFTNPNAATSFVANTLARAEQQLTFSEVAKLAPQPRHVGGFALAALGS